MTRHQLNTLGLAVLLLGLGAADMVYWAGPDRLEQSNRRGTSQLETADQDFTLSIEDSRKSSREVEMYYGKLGLVALQWSRRLDALKRPGPLALMITIFSTLAASGCFLAANRLPRP